MAAVLAAGCDAGGPAGRGDSAGPAGGAGGKADDTELPTSGPAVVRIVMAADTFNEGNVDVNEFEVYWGSEADPDSRVKIGEEFDVLLTGEDCVTVVSTNPAKSSLGQPDTITTQSCDLGLVPDPEVPSILALPTVTMTMPDLPVDFGEDIGLVGLGGRGLVSDGPGGYVGLPQGETFVFAPNEYELKLGHDKTLGFETKPHEWQVLPIVFGQFDDWTDGIALTQDPRTQIFVEAPAEASALPMASAKSKCRPDIDMWVSLQTTNGTRSYDLGEDQTLHFLPYAGGTYKLRLAGITVLDEWVNEDGSYVWDLHVPTFVHEVPEGDDGESGTYTIRRLGQEDGTVHCQGIDFPNMQRNSTFRVGTHLILPAGNYIEEITYEGQQTVQREFTLGG